MSLGKYSATFKFVAEGMGIAAPVAASLSNRLVELAVADERSCEFRMKVVIEKVDEADGARFAQSIAEALYGDLLQRLALYIERAVPPSPESFAFEPENAATVARGLSVAMSTAIAVGRALLDASLVEPCLQAALDAQSAQNVTPPMVATARRMFRVAAETADAVASFLTCYSALALVALHKGNHGQRSVDVLLLGVDATIPQTSYTDAKGKTKHETRYTEIRNRFVHAEERGNDPKRAAEDMSNHVRAFRHLTARVLQAL